MQSQEQPSDLLGIGQPSAFVPYTTEDGWTVILPGEEGGRRQASGKVLRAFTSVEITLSRKEDLDACIRHLEESDRRFAANRENPWDWAKVMIRDMQVRFGVAWYDRDFFAAKRDAYSDPRHIALYAKFGATLDNFKIEHFLVDDRGELSPAN
ncbi:hypothetical protein [Polyangium spumosum]|uniref:Uncharacterized protein n=1 Tax=Polyangium spumosum TaxID=889282 RepID=A0A6N7Q0Z9_9BACT|nr:hypothetical protein [Polyangium spumosum]MRG98142.1 hypothetical protein [Polyangium spumosum]